MDTKNGHFLPRIQKWQTESGIALINRRRNNRHSQWSQNLKWLDSLIIEIGLNLQNCDLYQDNLSASKVIKQLTKTKQLKHLLSKINLAQQYHADKLFEIIQTPTDEMIADSLIKPKSAYNHATVETARLGVYKMPNY